MARCKGVRDEGQSILQLSPASGDHRRAIRSKDLFGTQLEVVIEHNQRMYRLRITSSGKLILTA